MSILMSILFQFAFKSPDLHSFDTADSVWTKDVVLAFVQSHNSAKFAFVWEMTIQTIICKHFLWLLSKSWLLSKLSNWKWWLVGIIHLPPPAGASVVLLVATWILVQQLLFGKYHRDIISWRVLALVLTTIGVVNIETVVEIAHNCLKIIRNHEIGIAEMKPELLNDVSIVMFCFVIQFVLRNWFFKSADVCLFWRIRLLIHWVQNLKA